jgi:hypothetical protein
MWILLVISICLFYLTLQTLVVFLALKSNETCRPQKPFILSIMEDGMNYIYKIGLPELGANDVILRELHVTIDGVKNTYMIEDVSVGFWNLTLTENSVCEIFVVDIDDAGNRSPEGEKYTFTVLDIVPPKAPKAPVIMEVTEVMEETPVEETPVEETPVEETPDIEG